MNSVRRIILVLSLFFISINGLKSQDCETLSNNLTWDFQIVSTPLNPGDNFFIECYVTNFTQILSFQYTINFNPTVIEFENIDNLGSDLIGPVEVNSTPEALATGSLNTIWTNGNGEAQTIADGPIFKIFFTVIGDPGDCSQWQITSNVVDLEIAWELPDGSLCIETVNINDVLTGGDLCVECGTDLTLITNACSGELEFTACGGTGPYNYNIEGPGLDESGTIDAFEFISFSNLNDGLYIISLSDSAGNVLSSQEGVIDIVAGIPLEVSIDVINNISCPGDEGDLMATGLGGVEPYVFEWSNGLFTEIAEDLSAGQYTVVVTDANGCTAESAPIDLGTSPMVVTNVEIIGATCLGSKDGSVTITVEGGSPFNGTDYSFDGNIQPIGVYDNLDPGMFQLQIRDESGCLIFEDVEIPALGSGEYEIVEEQTVDCFGDLAYFEIDAEFYEYETFSLDSIPRILDENNIDVAYAMDPVSNNLIPVATLGPGNNVPGILPGDYTISFYTIEGCYVVIPYTVQEAPEIVITLDNLVDPDCGGNPGQIDVSISGGVGQLDYEWSDGQPDLSFEVNLGGTYTLIVTDENMCSDSLVVDVLDAGSLGAEAQVVNQVGCGTDANSGSAEVTISGTSTNISYNWEDASGMQIGTDALVENLSAGTYFVTVTDEDMDCTQETSVTIEGAGAFFFEETISPLSCFGGSDAEIEIGIIGGSQAGAPSFAWAHDDNLSFNFASNLGAGDYTITVTDADGCELDTTITIPNPPQMQLDVNGIQGVSCYNGNDGIAISTASNSPTGETEFTYYWGDADADTLITNEFGEIGETFDLTSGALYSYAYDGACFSDTIFFDLPNADQILVDSLSSQILNTSCAGTDEGILDIIITGGSSSGSYNYEWDTGETTSTLTDLASGSYTLLVMDDNNCEEEFVFELTEPDSLFLFLNESQTSNVSCFGSNSAIIATFASGGTGSNYDFSWTPDISDSNIAVDVGEGDYEIIVTDEAGCTASLEYQVESSTPIEVSFLPIEQAPCNGQPTMICIDTIFGGSGSGYTYQVSFGENISVENNPCFDAIAGDVTVTINDGAGCPYDQPLEFNVEQPDPISIELADDLELELGDTSLVIDAIINGPNPIDTITWSSANGLWDCENMDCSSINVYPTTPTIYNIDVIDANGCTQSAEVFVNVKAVRNFYAPNIFTPDSDGNNDLFNPFVGKGVTMINDFKIYDRWGNLVHSVENIDPGDEILYAWNGQIQGINASQGVYVYIAEVTFFDDEVILYKGSVTLLR